MLSKTRRLSAARVRSVLKAGKVLRTPTIVVKYSKADASKFAALVSKKVARSAVERNRIRRRVYDTLPRPLPSRVEAVFLIQKNTLDFASDIKTICSKLSS